MNAARMPVIALLALCAITAADARAQVTFLDRNKDSWRRQLDNPTDAKVRRSAAFALGKIGGAVAINPLIAVLRDDRDAKVREAAAFALGEIGIGEVNAVQALQTALRDDDPYVRRSAAVALGMLGPSASVAADALEQQLGDDDPNVRQNIAWALGRIGVEKGEGLERALRDRDPLVKRDAANSLRNLSPAAARPALNALLDCCETGNSELRKTALNVLSKIVTPEDKNAIPVLRRVIEDTDPDVRNNAALTLANIGGDEAARAALPVLSKALKFGDMGLRRQAAALLRNFGAAAAELAPTLEATLQNKDDAVLRANSAVALGGIGEAAAMAIPSLVTRVSDPKEDANVRFQSASALSRMGTPPAAVNAVPTLLRVLGDRAVPTKVRERILWSLRAHNVGLRNLDVYPTLEKVLNEQQPEGKALRYDCAYMLGILQGPEVKNRTLEVLHQWLQDDSIQLYDRTDVKGGTNTIEGGGTTGAANVVERGGSDGRIMVLQALAEIGVERVRMFPPIIQQLRMLASAKDLDQDVKKTAQKLLLAFQ